MRLRPFELEIEPRLDENAPFHPRYATIGYYADTAANEFHVVRCARPTTIKRSSSSRTSDDRDEYPAVTQADLDRAAFRVGLGAVPHRSPAQGVHGLSTSITQMEIRRASSGASVPRKRSSSSDASRGRTPDSGSWQCSSPNQSTR